MSLLLLKRIYLSSCTLSFLLGLSDLKRIVIKATILTVVASIIVSPAEAHIIVLTHIKISTIGITFHFLLHCLALKLFVPHHDLM